MSLTPNITQAGRIARGISGGICAGGGAAVLLFGWPDGPITRWGLAVLLIGVGLFQCFEARRGWCVMRAMGFRTPT